MTGSTWLQVVKGNRSLRLMLAALFSSVIGNGLFYVALSLELLRSGGARELAIVLGAFGLAQLVIAPFAGVLADRYRRTRVMFCADILQFCGTLGFALLHPAGLHSATLAVLCLFALVTGTGASLFRPASSALLSSLLSDPDKRIGNALRSLCTQSGTVLGPLLGAALITVISPRGLVAVDAVTFLVSAAADLLITEAGRNRAADVGGETVFGDLRDGIRAIGSRPWLVAVMASTAVQSLIVVSAEQALVPVIAVRYYGTPALGMIVAAESVGAILGGLVSVKYGPRRRGLVAQLCTLTAPVWLAVLAYHPALPLILALSALVGVGFSIFGVLYTTALQDQVPAEQLGRVFSVDQVVRLGFVPLGLIAVSSLLLLLAPSTLLLLAAAAGIFASLVPLAVAGSQTFTSQPARPEHSQVLSTDIQ